LLSIYKNYSNFISIEQLKTILIVELPALLSENDLHISYVALKLSTLICKTHGPSLIQSSNILNQVLLLVKSPLLQGLALESSIEFFISIVQHKQPGLEYKDIVFVIFYVYFIYIFILYLYTIEKMLVKPIREQSNLHQAQNNLQQNNFSTGFNEFSNNNTNLAVHKQAFYSIAKIIASLTVTNQQDGKVVIEQFINDIKVN
jgi:cullin-associated NEDD8-dissociated protein 1